MLKDAKIETKLANIMIEFVGQKLSGFRFKETSVDDKEVVLLELMFEKRTAVLALDRNLTVLNKSSEKTAKLLKK